MSRCPDLEQLRRLAAGELGPGGGQTLEAHVDVCPACKKTLSRLLDDSDDDPVAARWQRLDRAGPASPAELPEGFRERLLDNLPLPRADSGPADGGGSSALAFPDPPTPRGPLGRLGPYHIMAEKGRGTYGRVFQAYDEQLDCVVALKVLRPELAADPKDRARFEEEARKAAAVRHDHVVTVHRVGSTPGFSLPYFVMEYIDGETLSDRLKRQTTVGPREAVGIVWQVALGLEAAHACGLVHRDIKPSNVMLQGGTGRAKITDFGLARAVEARGEGSTQSGAIVGTPLYMSPEQIVVPRRMDRRSDVYSLGVVLYELLTGRPPFGGTPHMVLQQAVHDEPPPPRKLNDAIPRDVETMTLKCLAKEPARRYQSAGELAEDLRRWLDGRPVRARPVGMVGRLWRWCRRKPALATASGLAAAALVAVAVVSTAFGLRLGQEQARTEAALRDSQRRSATLALDKGLTLCEQGEVGPGMLWLVRGLELAPADAGDLRRVLRANLAGWRRRLSPLRALLPHRAEVTLVAFGPDGRRFLTGGSGETVYVWDVATGGRVAVLQHEARAQAAAFSPDGRIIVTGCTDGTFRLWEAATGRPRPGPPHRHRDEVWAVAFSPDGRTLLTGGEDGSAWLWDTATGRPRSERPCRHDGAVVAVAFSPDGRKALTGSHDGTARLWDAATGRELPESPLRHGDKVLAVAFGPDGKAVATGSADTTARLWVATTGRRLDPPLRHRREVLAVGFSPYGGVLATASSDRTVRLWEATTRERLGDPLLHQGEVTGVAFHPRGKVVVTGATDNIARIWEVADARPWSVVVARKPLGPLLPHQGEVHAVAFSPDGQFILTGSSDRMARLWEAPSATPSGRSLPSRYPVRAAAFSPDGRTALTVSDGHPDLWEVATGRPLDIKGQPIDQLSEVALNQVRRGLTWGLTWISQQRKGPLRLPFRHDGVIRSLALSPDGHTILTGGSDGTAHLWDRATGQSRILSPAHDQPVVAVALGDRTAVTGSEDCTARLWDAATGEPRGQPLRHDGSVVAVALSPDGNTVLTGSWDGTARLWEAATGRELPGSPLRHGGKVLAIAFSRDGRTVATGSADGTTSFWNVATGQPLGAPLRHQGPVMAVAFSPDGRRVLTGSQDKTAGLWEVATGQSDGLLLQHQHRVQCVAFSPDGTTALTGSEDGTARLWDVATGKPCGPPVEHRAPVTAVAFSPDGRVVLTGGWDRTARLWEVPTALEGEVGPIVLWVQVLSGLELDSGGTVRQLDPSRWQERRQRLEGHRLPG
jgi:WD40 repeat protein